ncbi:MFS transporter [Oscillatoria sp. FACHB-1407]|uniref:MFS transporter n=1 Tax=Oscillatoria sp. FACHB-1407 TaxID=2692847 RepID=UPI00168677CD|nr:MFS transporter [Oscillatoria sp. FACHB-1407]MBD2462336.1 MFS transporter [Oscillatoria sp. FACHB-1407]
MLPVGEASRKQTVSFKLPKQTPKFLVLLAAGCLTTMTGGVVSPVLPEMVQHLNLDPKWAGMLVSMHALTIALFTPILGILADRIGKLKVMIPSLILYSLFGISGAFIPHLVPLLVVRGLLGAASGGVAAASIGLLGSMYDGDLRSRVLGYATSAMTTAAILVPIIGGWVGADHWQRAFYLYALGVPLALVAMVVLNDKPSQKASAIAPGAQREQLFKSISHPQTLQLYAILALAATVVYAVVIYTPLYLKATIGAGPELNGIVLGVRAIGAAIISAVGASWIAHRIGVKQTIALGFFLMAVTLITIPFLHQIELILPTAVVFGIGFGIITPNTYNALANRAPAEVRASVLAIGTGANSLGQFISPLMLGSIWKYMGLPTVFFVTAAIALGMSIASLTQLTNDQ